MYPRANQFPQSISLTTKKRRAQDSCLCCFVFIKPILGNRYGVTSALKSGQLLVRGVQFLHPWADLTVNCFLNVRFLSVGINVLAKNRRNWQVNFIDSGLEVAKTRFQTFLRGKSVLFKWKCQIREFHAHAMERGEVLKRYCGWQKEATLLKQTPKNRTFILAAGALQQNAWKSLEVSKSNTRKFS